MAEVIYTVKDRQTDEILCRGSCGYCADFVGCGANYLAALSRKVPDYKNSKYARYKIERQTDGKRGGDHRKDIICCDCGVLVENANATRKRCAECAEKHAKEIKRDRMRRLRENGLVANPYIKRIKADGCEGCIYYFSEYKINRCCNYYLLRGVRRPCPPAKECTVKVERVKKNAEKE